MQKIESLLVVLMMLLSVSTKRESRLKDYYYNGTGVSCSNILIVQQIIALIINVATSNENDQFILKTTYPYLYYLYIINTNLYVSLYS